MTSGRRICLARHQSERRGWNRSVAFTRADGDDSNKHMASRAARPPFTDEDARGEPEGRRRAARRTLFMWRKSFFYVVHLVPFFFPPAVSETLFFLCVFFFTIFKF